VKHSSPMVADATRPVNGWVERLALSGTPTPPASVSSVPGSTQPRSQYVQPAVTPLTNSRSGARGSDLWPEFRAGGSRTTALQAEKAAKAVIDFGREGRCDTSVPVPEGAWIGEPDSGQIDGATTSQVAGQGQQDAGNVPISPAVDHHNDRIVADIRVRADDQDADASAAQRVVDDVAARRRGALTYHAALNSANTAASSPSSEACHAAAAATARRSRYSRIASATNADLLLPATAALSSSPSSSSRVMEMLTVTSVTLSTTLLSARSLIRSACHRCVGPPTTLLSARCDHSTKIKGSIRREAWLFRTQS
jgi:hypothetical protein